MTEVEPKYTVVSMLRMASFPAPVEIQAYRWNLRVAGELSYCENALHTHTRTVWNDLFCCGCGRFSGRIPRSLDSCSRTNGESGSFPAVLHTPYPDAARANQQL